MRRIRHCPRLRRLVLCFLLLAAPGVLVCQTPAQKPRTGLAALSDSLERLSQRTGPAVVQIMVSGLGPAPGEDSSSLVVSAQRAGGSGVILDPKGYIVTNRHVVQGAQSVRVLLSERSEPVPERTSILPGRPRLREARILGTDEETDLAVLKIDVPEGDLPYLELGDSEDIRPGQLVLAVGSPLGLKNSVTLGVVSSVARQIEPEDPMIYIQTDAAINPGSSGGALVNADGKVVGINTMIFSRSGGNEGVGFAAPSNIVETVYEQIREHGRVRRGEIGATAQTISPLMAQGLDLPRDWGVILADVRPGGPAGRAGLKVGDIVFTLDGKRMENGRQFRVNLYQRRIGDVVEVDVLRNSERLRFQVPVLEQRQGPERFLSLVNQADARVEELGVLALSLNAEISQLLPPLRRASGVVVAATVAEGPYWSELFESGDVIYSVNRRQTRSVEQLRKTLQAVKPGEAVVVQLEREGKMRWVTFEQE